MIKDGKVAGFCAHFPGLCEMLSEEVIRAKELNKWDDMTALMMMGMITSANMFHASRSADMTAEQLYQAMAYNAELVKEVVEQAKVKPNGEG